MENDATESRDELLSRFRQRFDLENLSSEDIDLAFTHRSYAYEHDPMPDNERLEFLGDAILSSICSEYLYSNYPHAPEGELSKRRSRLVSRVLLGQRAEEMGLGALLLLGRGERRTGGGHRRSVLGSALESLIAIVYLRSSYDVTQSFVRTHVLEPLTVQIGEDEIHGDFKSALQEWSQEARGCIPVYTVVSDTGPDHAKAFYVEVEVDGERLAKGEGSRIKAAENDAARQALMAVQGREHPSGTGKG